MALIKCPECQKEVSDKAISCPNCGNPITEDSPSKKFYQIENWEPRKEHKALIQDIRDLNFTPKAILGIIAFFLILGVVIFRISSTPNQTATSSPSMSSNSPYIKGYANGQAIALVSMANIPTRCIKNVV
jgi:uncharacterized membrane protein YvbJ